MPRSSPLLAASLLVAVTASSPAAPTEPSRRVVNRIVAIVDDEVITLGALDRRAATLLAQVPPAELAQQRAALLDAMVDAELLAAEADRRRLVAEPAEVDAALAEIAKNNNLTMPELLAAAAAQGLDERTYRAELRRQILEMRVAASWIVEQSSRGVPPPENGIEGARERLLATLRTRAFIEVRL